MNRTFHIRYTSDIHGHFFPTDYATTEPKNIGLMRLMSEYPHDKNTLILDGGDSLQGSALTNFYERLSEDEKHLLFPDGFLHPVSAIMNMAGYQYVTLGNHDFNYGLKELNTYLQHLNAVCLCANIVDKAGKLPIQPYAIHTLENGLRIGLVGVCTHYVRVWEKPETLQQLQIRDAFETARDLYPEVRSQCDFTILLYHGGYECDLDTGVRLSNGSENQAYEMCTALDYDLVLTGHQHIAMPGRFIHGTYTVQPPFRAQGVCAIDVTPGTEGAAFTSTILPADHEPDLKAMAFLKPLEERVQHWLDFPAGHLESPLPYVPHLTAALHGSLVANFINTVQLALSGAQISTCALPNEYKGFSEHPTIRDIVSTYIYSNTLVVLEITGAGLKQYIERSAEYFDFDNGVIDCSVEFMRPKVQHYNYDYFSGIDYVIDVSKPIGSRVLSIQYDGREIKPEETFSLCINSYRHSGAGEYPMLPDLPVLKDIQEDVADAIIEYILSHPEVHIDRHRYSTILPVT